MSACENMVSTLDIVSSKISVLLSPPTDGKRMPVDCVAFDCMYTGMNDNCVVSYHYPVCRHPDRGGTQTGCLLTKTIGNEGKIVRVVNSECPFRVRRDSKGSAALEQNISEISELERTAF